MKYPMIDSDLEKLKLLEHAGVFRIVFGVTSIQRNVRIGYNRACYLRDHAIEKGVLVRCEHAEHLVMFT